MGKLAENLAALMAQNGLNQVELAKKAGIKQPLISSYLHESRSAKHPSLRNLLKLAVALGCTLEQLTGLPATATIEKEAAEVDLSKLSDEERALLDAYSALEDTDWRKQMIDDLLLKRKKAKEADGDDT